MTQSTPNSFKHWHMPQADAVGKNHIEFIKILGGPTWITIDGKDTSRQRAIVTLLHGNEPSGLKAIHQFILSGRKPETNLGIFVVSVNAALLHPYFSHRYLPGEADFNRCFKVKGFKESRESNQEILAGKISNTLKSYAPEAIIDTHNTSAHSDIFGVTVSSEKTVLQVAGLFSRKLVVLDQVLGTLIEQDLSCPIVTIEFGGFLDPKADKLAQNTLDKFIEASSLFRDEPKDIQLLERPLRLEINSTANLHYSSSVQDEADITIFNTIDQMNFSKIDANVSIGWTGNNGINDLTVRSKDGNCIAEELFHESEGFILTKIAMTIFMATTDAYIATNDCLMYLCPENSDVSA
ncbi:MAG: hypothetical protein JKY88_18055 [Pseudomonadales bacterium]|nr:hypothetical protein [Pseudomonadales bacterium]